MSVESWWKLWTEFPLFPSKMYIRGAINRLWDTREEKLSFEGPIFEATRAHIDLASSTISILSSPIVHRRRKMNSRVLFPLRLRSDDRIFQNRSPRDVLPRRESSDVGNLADTYFVFSSSFRFSLKAPSFIVFIPSVSWLLGSTSHRLHRLFRTLLAKDKKNL